MIGVFCVIEFTILHYSYLRSHYYGTIVWYGSADQKVDVET